MNKYRTIPFEINFDHTIDETVGLIDDLEDYDTIGFKLNLNEDIVKKLSDYALSDDPYPMSDKLRDSYNRITNGSNFNYSVYASVPFYDFDCTYFAFGFASDTGHIGSNICLSEKATADLRIEIERYLHSIGKDLKEMYEESRKEPPYEM